VTKQRRQSDQGLTCSSDYFRSGDEAATLKHCPAQGVPAERVRQIEIEPEQKVKCGFAA